MNDIEVKSSNIAGRGVFAKRIFLKGQEIEFAHSLRIAGEDIDLIRQTVLDEYWFYSEEPGVMLLLTGCGAFYNHDAKPNADFQETVGGIRFFALRMIRPGDEITIDYGDEKCFPIDRRVPRMVNAQP